MRRKKKIRAKGDEVKLEMTAMIDVVFQLLIFFIVTLKQEDILSQLDVMRPAPDPDAKEETQIEPIKILIGVRGFVFGGRPMSEGELNTSIARVAKYNRNATVMIQCTMDSDHRWLIKALDICTRNEMTKLAVFSM